MDIIRRNCVRFFGFFVLVNMFATLYGAVPAFADPLVANGSKATSGFTTAPLLVDNSTASNSLYSNTGTVTCSITSLYDLGATNGYSVTSFDFTGSSYAPFCGSYVLEYTNQNPYDPNNNTNGSWTAAKSGSYGSQNGQNPLNYLVATSATVTSALARYWRLTITDTGGTGYPAHTQLAEFHIYSSGTQIGLVPAPPNGLAAVSSNGQLAFSWNASTGANSYVVTRSTTSGGTYSQVATPTGTSYIDYGLANGTAYYYKVASVGTGGTSAYAGPANATYSDPCQYGIKRYYFSDTTLTKLASISVDPNIDFHFDGTTNPPGGGNFSIRWLGKIIPPVTGTYTFYVNTDDGSRLWVNGTQLVNDWNSHFDSGSVPPGTGSGTISLTANQPVDIKMEYYENSTSPGDAQLWWAYTGQSAIKVPQCKLFVGSAPTPPQSLVASPGNGSVSLSWTAPAVSWNNQGCTAIYTYKVYRMDSQGVYQYIGQSASTSYTDTGLTNGVSQSYKVLASTNCTDSQYSNAASAIPNTVQSITLPANVVGGNTLSGTITLAAAASGANITLSTNNSTIVTFPTNPIVAGSSTSVPFTIKTAGVASNTTVSVTATFNGSQSTSTVVLPASVVSLSFPNGTIIGTSTATGTFTLNGDPPAGTPPSGGATVTFSSTNTAVIPAPASVGVTGAPSPHNSGSVTITSNAAPTTSVTVTASYNGTASFTFTVQQPTVATPAFSINGGVFLGSVKIALSDSTSGASIYYTTDGSAPTQSATLYTGPFNLSSTATVKAEAYKANYLSSAVATQTFTAAQGPTVAITSPINGTAYAQYTALPISAQVTAGNASICKVDLYVDGVLFRSITTPPYLSIWPVQTIGNHNTYAIALDADNISTQSATVPFTVSCSPSPLASFVLLASSLTGGAMTSGNVALSGPAGTDGEVVSLVSSDPAVVVPAFILIPAGQTNVNFNITTNAVSVATTAVITATLHADSIPVTLQLAPATN